MTFITTEEAAKQLGVRQYRVLCLVYEGNLKSKLVGQEYMIDDANIKSIGIGQAELADSESSVTALELAASLGVSPMLILRRIREGRLPAKRVGQEYVIEKAACTLGAIAPYARGKLQGK